jgi:hypothetical protein
MKYNKFCELVADEDPENIAENCIKYLKEYRDDAIGNNILKIFRKHIESEYIVSDIIKLLAKCDRDGY